MVANIEEGRSSAGFWRTLVRTCGARGEHVGGTLPGVFCSTALGGAATRERLLIQRR